MRIAQQREPKPLVVEKTLQMVSSRHWPPRLSSPPLRIGQWEEQEQEHEQADD